MEPVMLMTLTEKILAHAAGKRAVRQGEIVTCKVDLICIDEIQIPFFINTLERMGAQEILKDRTVLVIDHHSAPTSLDQAKANQMVRDFSRSKGIALLEGGIKDQLLWENGYIRPGTVLVGTDSHMPTCGAFGMFAAAFGPSDAAIMAVTGEYWFKVPATTRIEVVGTLRPYVTPKDIGLYILGKKGVTFATYQAVEFCGPTVQQLGMDGRVTLCNMSTEMGAKNGIVAADAVTDEFLGRWGVKAANSTKYSADPGAAYSESLVVDASDLEPLVAFPHSPGNVRPVSTAKGIRINQGFIGSCGNGNIEDLRIAASLLKGRSVQGGTRLIITPASRKLYLQALSEGLIETFLSAGAMVSGGSCSVCAGFEGCLAPQETCITASPRNFQGRMGSPEASIYLGSPATVAASCIQGTITDPRAFA